MYSVTTLRARNVRVPRPRLLPQEEARLQTDGQELPRRGPTAEEPAVVAAHVQDAEPPPRGRGARARVIVQRAHRKESPSPCRAEKKGSPRPC